MILAGAWLSTATLFLGMSAGLLWPTLPLAFFAFAGLMAVGNGLMLPNATAGLLSVRPLLAGTASGLGGALMIGGGAVLSQFAGSLLNDGSGTIPLQAVMLASAVLALASILVVMVRARSLSRQVA